MKKQLVSLLTAALLSGRIVALTVTAADGTLTLTRTDACTVLLDDEEIGTLTLISRMTISAV